MIDIWRERDGAAWISLRFFLFYLFSFFFCFFQMSGREQRSLFFLTTETSTFLGLGLVVKPTFNMLTTRIKAKQVSNPVLFGISISKENEFQIG